MLDQRRVRRLLPASAKTDRFFYRLSPADKGIHNPVVPGIVILPIRGTIGSKITHYSLWTYKRCSLTFGMFLYFQFQKAENIYIIGIWLQAPGKYYHIINNQ